MKLSDITGRRMNEIPSIPDSKRPHPHTSVGIEVELEGVTNYRQPFKRWHLDENEGSLQGGVEFVSEPVWGTAITDALNELDIYLKTTTAYLSRRTSVHLHLNMLDITYHDFVHFFKIYLCYEPSLFRLHERWKRIDNIYCIPATRSTVIQRAYARMLDGLGRGEILPAYLTTKYSALNINPLSSLGTVEFRHMGGSSDVAEIDRWINIILQLKVAAISSKNVDDPAAVWGTYQNQLDIRDEDIEQGLRLINRLAIFGDGDLNLKEDE